MVVNVHKYVKQTWPTDEYPYKTSIMEKTASILGIGVASVYRIIKEYATTGNVQSPSKTKKGSHSRKKWTSLINRPYERKFIAFI